jgi:hypothetical protein
VDRVGSSLIIIDVVIPFQVVLVVVVVIVIASPPTPPEEWRAEMGKGGSGLGGNHLALSYNHRHGVRGQAEQAVILQQQQKLPKNNSCHHQCMYN